MPKHKKNTILYGKRSVTERLLTFPQTVIEVIFEKNFKDTSILQLVKTNRISFSFRSERDFSRLKKADRTQKIMAIVKPFSFTSLDEQIQINRSLVFFDSLNDPHNLGAVMRTLACLGGFSLVLSERSNCPLTDTVFHVSSGAENYIPICRVPNMLSCLSSVKRKGYSLVGTDVDPRSSSLESFEFPLPLALVFGSEGHGLSDRCRSLMDDFVFIPMMGAPLSYNLAASVALVSYQAYLASSRSQ